MSTTRSPGRPTGCSPSTRAPSRTPRRGPIRTSALLLQVTDLTKEYPTPRGPLRVLSRRVVRARAGRRRRDHGTVGQRQELAALHRSARSSRRRPARSRSTAQPVPARCVAVWRRSATGRSASSSRITACCRSARCSRTCWSRRWSRRSGAVGRGARPRARRARRPRGPHRSSAGRAVGRRAAARGDRARADPGAAAAAVRRADRQPRSDVRGTRRRRCCSTSSDGRTPS